MHLTAARSHVGIRVATALAEAEDVPHAAELLRAGDDVVVVAGITLSGGEGADEGREEDGGEEDGSGAHLFC